MTIQEAKNIYMVGVGGVGMLALALILKKRGKNVYGVDAEDFYGTDTVLDEHNIFYKRGFSRDHITKEIDLVITTGAHGGLNNEEVKEAVSKGIPVLTHAEALGEVMKLYKSCVSVCGTHGKTSTSAMAAHVMKELGIKGGYAVGSVDISGMDSGDSLGDELFIAEADEYVVSSGINNTPRFSYQHPDYIICTSVDHDHVDVYKTLDDVKVAFSSFFKQLGDGKLIYTHNDENIRSIVSTLDKDKAFSYGFSGNCDMVLVKDKGYRVKVGSKEYELKLKLPGEHFALNATSVVALFYLLGHDVQEVVDALGSFKTAKLRFEEVLKSDRCTVIVDYAHHPTEVRETIKAARDAYPEKRLVVYLQPHSYSRTEVFKNEFVKELSKADVSFILDIYGSARETDDGAISSEKLARLADDMDIHNVYYVPNADAITNMNKAIQQGDVVLLLGAGDFYMLNKDNIFKALS